MIMTILVYIAEREATLHLLFETVSAFGTVGYSLGVTPSLSPAGKLVLSATMFLGRLGPLTLMAALARPAAPALVRFAEEKILIG
jgi:trk system potassium uptake protein